MSIWRVGIFSTPYFHFSLLALFFPLFLLYLCKQLFIYFGMCLCVCMHAWLHECVCVYWHVSAHVEKSENNLQDSVFSFHRMGFKDQTQVVMLFCKHLCPLNCISFPCFPLLRYLKRVFVNQLIDNRISVYITVMSDFVKLCFLNSKQWRL